mmetsp:Transcript_32126/g.91115  ORF Transcript_32126/g.91115 Transcript_32126/m.91115 type:complete len:253 (-) Transcript_32126:276-1034(-)
MEAIEESADWSLRECCNTSQIVLISCFLGFLVINGLLFRFSIIKPLKLIAVFIHEMSHATACWLTCGKVTGIEVYDNEGGVTKYIGGVQTCIIPAGYLGCSFWGMVFIILSSDLIASTVAASGFTLALIVALFFSPNRTMVWLNLGFVAVTAALVLLQWLVPVIKPGGEHHFPFLCFVVLYYGTFIGSFGVYDIYDDTISRSVEGSDSMACHELYPLCHPRCVGVMWALMAIIFMGTGVYFALLWMGAHGSF